MRRCAVPFAFALVVAVSCSGGDEATVTEGTSGTKGSTATTATTVDAAIDQAAVELLEAGSEPRARLRFAPQPGAEQLLTLTQRQHLEITTEGQSQTVDVPATEIDLTYRVVSVDDGRIEAEVTYASPRVVEEPGSDPATVAQLREMMASFEGATAAFTFDDRGSLLAFEPPDVRVSGPAGPFLEQLLSGLGDQVAALSMPFPEEAIGVGARWRVTSGGTIAGLGMEIESNLRLIEAADGSAAAELAQTFTLVPGPTELAGTPAEVEGGTLTATGTVRWRLDGIAPLLSQTIEGNSVISVGQAGRLVRVEQFQRQMIEISER